MLNQNFGFSGRETTDGSEIFKKQGEDILGDDSENVEKEEIIRNKIEELEARNKLIEEGKKYGNNFRFVDPAIKLKDSELPDGINPRIFNGKINPVYLETLESQFQHLKRFISASIIKDSFAGDHYKRREWINKYLKLLSPESQECYRGNRLAFKNAASIGTLLNFLEYLKNEDEDLNLEMLSDLENTAKLIPEAIKNNKNAIYYNMSEEEKIKTMEDLAPAVVTLIKILGAPAK